MKELPREERGRRAERCREGGEWSAETLKWRREGDGRVGGRGQSPFEKNRATINRIGKLGTPLIDIARPLATLLRKAPRVARWAT